jgi:hypothetical protein
MARADIALQASIIQLVPVLRCDNCIVHTL